MFLLSLQEDSHTLSSGKKIDHTPASSILVRLKIPSVWMVILVLWLKLQKTIYIYVCVLKHSVLQLHPAYPRQISSAGTNSKVRLDQQDPYLCRPHKNNKSDMTLKFFTGLNPEKMAV